MLSDTAAKIATAAEDVTAHMDHSVERGCTPNRTNQDYKLELNLPHKRKSKAAAASHQGSGGQPDSMRER